MLARCSVCQGRHRKGEKCHEPGEEGHISREELLDAFRLGHGVCLPCQSVWHGNDGKCPDCGRSWEEFDEGDLP